MTRSMFARTPVPRAARVDAATGPERRQGLVTSVLIATVSVVDQTTKWWAWRNASTAIINSGGTWIIGQPVSGLLSGPVSGPILDLLNVGLLTFAGFILVSRPRSALFLVTGALMIAGWSSNLLDRLGMHAVTAPGSVRGAVDFISLGPPYWNVADFVIVAATVLFLVAAGTGGHRRVVAATTGRPRSSLPRARTWGPRRSWAAVVGATVAVVLSVPAAVHAGSADGMYSSRPSSAATTSHV
jgi:lipoprotein signal peptidase